MVETFLMVAFALDSDTEGDSDGSMLTRAALVSLYANLDFQLYVFVHAALFSETATFEHAEMKFLTETTVDLDELGDPALSEDFQRFRDRISGVPRILCRRLTEEDLNISLGDRAGSNLLAYKSVRDDLMHTGVGKQIPRVTKSELYEAYLAVQAYFRQLGALAPKLFGVYTFLTDETTALEKKRIAKGLHKS
jgi:hypothetical protein